jgi:hypothetical protein
MGDLSLDLDQSQLAKLVTGCEPSVVQARQVRNRGEQIANGQDVFQGVLIWLAGNAPIVPSADRKFKLPARSVNVPEDLCPLFRPALWYAGSVETVDCTILFPTAGSWRSDREGLAR